MNARIIHPRHGYRTVRSSRTPSGAGLRGVTCRLPAVLLIGGLLTSAVPAKAGDHMKPETLEKIKQAAVLVFTAESKREKGDTPIGSGSGYFINNTGLMITNNHVVDPMHMKSPREKQQWHYKHGALTWQVITDSGVEGDEKEWDATVLYQNETADQAILQVYDENSDKLRTPNYLRIQPESRLRERLPVWALGFPGGDQQKTSRDKHPLVTVTNGHVLDTPRTPGGRIRMVFTDVVVRPGNSGGAMVDSDGLLVGTPTLMRPPPGREDTGGAKYSALVPAALTADMIRYAFILGKIEPGTDVTPFTAMLTREGGRLDVPEFPRHRDHDVLYYENGDRIYGKIETDSIKWKWSLGEIDVPTNAVAYRINNDEGSHLFIEGGNRIPSVDADVACEFTPEGSSTKSAKIDGVQTIAFRTSGRQLKPFEGRAIIFETELAHLRLENVKGTVIFEGRFPIDVKLEDISRIDMNEDDQQVVMLNDGRRMTGRFADGTFKATIVGAEIPIEFGLADVEGAWIEVAECRKDRVAGLDLLGVLEGADFDVTRMAKTLAYGSREEITSARAESEALLSSPEFRKMPDSKKEQYRLLAAVGALRDGDPEVAGKAFRKCLRAGDDNIATYAKACNALLRRFEDFSYKDRQLSNQAAFAEAGIALADEYVRSILSLFKDAKNFEGRSKVEYVKTISGVKKNEDAMKIAAIFMGTQADDQLVRLWNLGVAACRREVRRIDREIEEKQSGSGSSRGAGARARREIDELNEHKEKVEETYYSYMYKLYEWGFRIEDPDIQERFEQERQPGETPEQDEP